MYELGRLFDFAFGLDFSIITTFASNFLKSIGEGIDVVIDILGFIPVIAVSMPSIFATTFVLVLGIRIVFNIL